MRLLDTSTITLHEFHGLDIPPYAILSHTWGKEEVSFQDLPLVKLQGPARYSKIARCCALAASEGHQYVWIDTCCIDKTSSAELSEAINSMYRWYQNSKICYAYLEDVSVDSLDVMQEFHSSRWFTRGWTLQELLAPRNVAFYDKRWTKIGDKSRLLDQILEITGIQHNDTFKPTSASVAAKMSWASQRLTTRSEDLAYCLMGLFDVNMPLLYGEGEKAFLRLQHEIIKNYDDESIFAWRDSTLEQSGMFALSPAAFADSGNIVTSWFHQVYRHDATIVTNRGLAIETKLQVLRGARSNENQIHVSPDQTREYLPLHCGYKGDFRHIIMLDLKRVSSDDFVRISPERLSLYDPKLSTGQVLESRRIYVRPRYLLKYQPPRPATSVFTSHLNTVHK